METNNRIISGIRILLCIILLGIWSLWIINLPDFNELKRIPEESKIIEAKTNENLQNTSIENIEKIKNQTEIKNPTKNTDVAKAKSINKELPKLANLEVMSADSLAKIIPATQIKDTSKANKNTNDLNVNLPKFASATREALLNSAENKNKNNNTKTDLRNKINIEKSSLMPVSNTLIQRETAASEEEFNISWLPKYLVQKKGIDEKINDISNSLEKITSQLELVGIITNDDGNNAAIIKDKLNNKIEILKKKDEYQGLKITEITNEEVKFINSTINKTFIMKLSKSN